MTVLEYLERTFDYDRPWSVRKRVTCKDGFSFSASAGTDVDKFDTVAISYPSDEDEILDQYGDETSDTDACYVVPLFAAEKLIEKHGGLDLPCSTCNYYRKAAGFGICMVIFNQVNGEADACSNWIGTKSQLHGGH